MIVEPDPSLLPAANWTLIRTEYYAGSRAGLEVATGRHEINMPIGNDNCIEASWVVRQGWAKESPRPKEVMSYRSYLVHRSAASSGVYDCRVLYTASMEPQKEIKMTSNTQERESSTHRHH